MKFKASIDVMPLEALLDPQGKAVTQSMSNLGLNEISNVRIGKHITLFVEADNEEGAKKLPEKEEDNSKSRAPIIGSVLVLGMGAFLIYSKKSR